jgi:hypothetical protein
LGERNAFHNYLISPPFWTYRVNVIVEYSLLPPTLTLGMTWRLL